MNHKRSSSVGVGPAPVSSQELDEPPRAERSEIVQFLGWAAGVVVVLVCGWGVIGLVAYLAWKSQIGSFDAVVSLAALLDLVVFVMLERGYWLSRLMGLRINPSTPSLLSAVFLWLFGVPGLLLRSTAPRPAAAAPGAAPARRSPADATAQSSDTFREVIETVVFVIVLVLLLKSFVAEAFVIPTGSMAETLYGYQKIVTCPQCGHEFPVNCSSEIEESPPIPVDRCRCPNCLLEIRLTTSPEDVKRDHSHNTVLANWNSGDRVLVAKPFYDLRLRAPERYDVVVFKFPEGPQRNFTAMNYIKRLIGLPGNTIGVFHGNLYVATDLEYYESAPEGALHDRIEKELEDESDLPLRRRIHRNHTPKGFDVTARELLEAGSKRFEILRKPPEKMIAVRRPVYDNDQQAKDLLEIGFPARWAPESDEAPDDASVKEYQRKRIFAGQETASNWTPADAANVHGFKSPGQAGKIAWLRYRHLLRPWHGDPDPGDVKPELIRDLMGYNTGVPDRIPSYESLNWVGDLMLEFDLSVEAAEGEVIVELSKSVDRFQARFDLASGKCRLWRRGPGGKETQLGDEASTDVRKPGTYHIRFANFDQRLTLWVDRALPFGNGVDYDAPRVTTGGESRIMYAPYDKNDQEPASIGARGTGVSVHRLQLWRDTYYTNPSGSTDAALTMYVQPGHYLCLGDNSPQSSDSRSWGESPRDQRGGLVPERLMLGRALWVYWPMWPSNRFGPIE
jgi:signal peptidase I